MKIELTGVSKALDTRLFFAYPCSARCAASIGAICRLKSFRAECRMRS
jgi:hypothetical protein